ncbi:SEFIR domain-containing protein [Chitinophaga costaii]|uniref:SEFIR domain-containing protein n=1 Tax=Chitinophaga costaii TaxID=1335309 RepID=A0A1C4FW34_9BACT|nr:SEFIR domain-containing protein [Chitinophaga costaii]PUZ27277.1 hypothetical protein DCM91_08690 [Chitinophaga costaii]SCC60227.1 SEFIR domain-containing protein [Chitinophaga costaii]
MERDLRPYSFDHDLSFYQNKDNIPNQELVDEIIVYFTAGEGARVFDARTIMNLSYKEITEAQRDRARPEDIFGHLENLPLSDLERHVLLGTMLKWSGGYPVNFMEEEQQRVMLGIQKRFLAFPDDTPEKEFARRDEKRAQLFQRLGIGFTNALRYGVPVEQIFAEMEDDGEESIEKIFSNFESLFREAASQGTFGELSNKMSFAIRLSEVNYSFNLWLSANKGWDGVDEVFYSQHLTQKIFVEYLQFRQDQETIRKEQTIQRRASWHPVPDPTPPVTDTVAETKFAYAPPVNDKVDVPSDLVFVTYSWEEQEHNEKVLSLTNNLLESGENATMDKKEMQDETALELKTMMLRSIQNASKVIVVLSQGYKKKAESEKGGVFFEYRAILSEIDKFPNKYILVSFEPFSDDLLPLGFANRTVLHIKDDASYISLLHKLQDVQEIKFAAVAPTKPLLTARAIPPLFPTEVLTIPTPPPKAPPILTIGEERVAESMLPSDEHWVIHSLSSPAVQIFARLWVDEKKNLGSKWATIPSLEPGHQKELMWIRHCDIIELAWSDVTGSTYYHLRIQGRIPETKVITKAELEVITGNVGGNNDFLNRALVDFLRTFNLDISKLPFAQYEYFLRSHNMLLP